MSTFEVNIVPVTLTPHPNADKLSIVHVGGFQCVVNTEMFQGVERAAYVPPESVLSQQLADAYTGGKRLVKAKRLRGVVSHGLLIPHIAGALGENVADKLGIVHFEPEPEPLSTYGECERAPRCVANTYTDIENWRKHPDIICVDEPVVLTEKIHGANARYVFYDGKLHCGSRTTWKSAPPIDASYSNRKSMWWQAARQLNLEKILSQSPGLVLYGEVYGQVQDLKYGHAKGEVSFAAFDIAEGGTYMNYDTFEDWCMLNAIPMVPQLYRGPWTPALVEEHCNGTSKLAANVREGFVVRPLHERYHQKLGRVILKVVGDDYLTRT